VVWEVEHDWVVVMAVAVLRPDRAPDQDCWVLMVSVHLDDFVVSLHFVGLKRTVAAERTIFLPLRQAEQVSVAILLLG
jgi:hypothetical protein